jgi:hypothetical protein
LTLRRSLRLIWICLLGLVLISAFAFRNQVLRASLDPKQPFQIYRPPPAPDYGRQDAWALWPQGPVSGVADIFFIHPTTYSGGDEWNGPIDESRSSDQLDEVMIPNYAGPFASLGRVFAPRYRQASLYGWMSMREDAQDARRFAYADVRRAFLDWVLRLDQGRPLILVGVEQGGSIADRLLREEIETRPELLRRFAGAYLIQTVTPAAAYASGPMRACEGRRQARCVVAYMPAPRGDWGRGRRILQRAFVWGAGEVLEPLGDRPALCVNPLLGAATGALADLEANRGAANATDLEWGLRPPFMPRQVSAQCSGGILWVTRPKSPTLKASGGWADRLKAPGYNPFYADLEADARARLQALGPDAYPSVWVRKVPVMGR